MTPQQRLRDLQDGWARVDHALSAPRPPVLLIILCVVLSLAFCVNLLGVEFLAGRGAFWNAPAGTIGHGWADMATALTGYDYFQREAWGWPLLRVMSLGSPDGTNLAFTDSIPIVAILGRFIYRLTGVPVNLFGIWTGLCVIGPAILLQILELKMGVRSIAGTLAATVFGCTMPALLFRWGHPALMGQFEILIAFVLYAWRREGVADWRLLAAEIGLCVLALLTNSYLFLMVGGLVLAGCVQDLIDRRMSASRFFFHIAAIAGVLVCVIAAGGFAGGGASLQTIGFGIFSANLLGPVLPQRSGLFPAMSGLVVDATGGQYEGFAYLGIGGLVLLAASGYGKRRLWEAARRHPVLATVVIAFFLFALSDTIYLGPIKLFHIKLPDIILNKASVVRSSGRFVWPVLYAVLALAIAAVCRLRQTVPILAAACLLQWIDTGPLRAAITGSIQHPLAQPADEAAWRSALAGRSYVWVAPSFACLPDPPGWGKALALEIQLAAAQNFVPTNTVYQSRHTADCAAEQLQPPPAAPNGLLVYLAESPDFGAHRSEQARSAGCAASNRALVCAEGRAVAGLATLVQPVAGWTPPEQMPWSVKVTQK